MLALAVSLLLSSGPPPETLLRQTVARRALAQVVRMDPGWHPAQRDCAGLVRFVYRQAFKTLWPARLDVPLWTDLSGHPTDFADAETLVTGGSFVSLGRGDDARRVLQSGDLVAFRREDVYGEPMFHLMLVVVPPDRAQAPARVVYHPGSKDAAVRTGLLEALSREAPAEWRPEPRNPAFLGFFRFKEWMR